MNKREPDSSQWFPVTGQETTGTNWNTRNSKWTQENRSLLWV